MNKIYIVVIFLVLLILGFFVVGKSSKVEAPTVDNTPKDTTQLQAENQNKEIASVKEFIITGKNFSFEPSMIKVKKGDRVKITFENTAGFHDFKVDEYGLAAKQAQSPTTEIFEFTADKVGSFEYYCSVGTHRAMGMKGTLVVQ